MPPLNALGPDGTLLPTVLPFTVVPLAPTSAIPGRQRVVDLEVDRAEPDDADAGEPTHDELAHADVPDPPHDVAVAVELADGADAVERRIRRVAAHAGMGPLRREDERAAPTR